MRQEDRKQIQAVPPAPQVCDACGEEGGVTAAMRTVRFGYGEGNAAVQLTAEVRVYECKHCGIEFTDHHAEESRHAAVCRHLERLTPSEIRAIRRIHDATRDQFSAACGIGVASLARWELGVVIQNAGYDQYLRLLGDPRIYQRVKERRETRAPVANRYEGPRHFPAVNEPGRAHAQQMRFSLQR
jgi:DNA-binding transcriptional regulator YiaG